MATVGVCAGLLCASYAWAADIECVAGANHCNGTNGEDSILGSNRADDIDARDGEDLIRAGKGDDRVEGGEASDLLYGEQGDDMQLGGGGNDQIYDSKGDGAGEDTFKGQGRHRSDCRGRRPRLDLRRRRGGHPVRRSGR